MMYGYGMGFWGMILGTVFTLLILIGLVVLVVWAVRRTDSGSSSGTPGAGRARMAKDVLDERYARGEITREQYQQMKEDLEK